MNTYGGYSKKTITNASVLLAGGGDKSLEGFLGGIRISASKIQYKTADAAATWTDLITLVNTDENVKLTPKADNVNRPLMMINGNTSTNAVLTSTSMFSVGIYANANAGTITANGFIKTGSDSSHVLLGDGTHKALSDFSMAHSHPYLPLAGGTMNKQAVISRNNNGANIKWYLGRVYPMIKTTSYTGYNSILSMKTTNGSWDLGVYDDDTAYLTYITDANYDANSNTTTYLLIFPKKKDTLAVLGDIPTKVSQLTNDSGYVTSSGVTSITLKAGTGISIDVDNTAITSTGTRMITNSGVRSTTINGNYLRVNTNGTNADLTIPYATSANHFFAGQILPANTSGDANTMQLDGEGTEYTVLTNYHSNPKWLNMPSSGASNAYGGVVEIKGLDTSLKMQFAWYAIHNNETAPTVGLWFRSRANKGYVATDWHQVAMTDSNITGTAANVTGVVTIEHGGTGATTRLNAVKALTNENVGTDANYFLTITSSWGKAGYTSVANAKTVLAMTGATSSAAGTAGVVPAPPKDGYNTKFLRADGAWVVPTGTTYSAGTLALYNTGTDTANRVWSASVLKSIGDKYLPLSGGTMTGDIIGSDGVHMKVKMQRDTSNAVSGIEWLNTSDETIGVIQFHNTANRMIFNSIGASSIYSDAVGKYSFIVGSNELTYNTYSIWHSGNDGSGSGLDADLLDGLNSSDFARRFSYTLGYGKTVKLTFTTYYLAMVFGRATNGVSCDIVLIGTGYSTSTNHWRALYRGSLVSWCPQSSARGIEIKNTYSSGSLYINVIAAYGTVTFEEIDDLTDDAVTDRMALLSECSLAGHDHDDAYVKLNAGAAEQTIKNSISGIANGSIEIWRATSGGHAMIGFANGTTKTQLGMLGFRAANTPTYRNTSGTSYDLLHSGNSSVSGGGSTWGDSITVKINGTSKTLTIPSNPNTDENVKQAASATSSWRPVILGVNYNSTFDADLTETSTGQVYVSNNIRFKPSNGNLSINGAFIPGTTNTQSIGSTSYRWGSIYSVSGNFTGQITSSVAVGTPPFVITSTDRVVNLNADMLDGYHASDFLTSHLTVSGTFWGNSWTNGGSLSGKITVGASGWGGQLVLNRTNGPGWGAAIVFQGSGTGRGAIHMESNDLYVSDTGGTTRYKVLTENNWSSYVTDTQYYLTLNGSVKGHSSTTNLGSFYAPTGSGTSGQYLKSNGANSAPTWTTPNFATTSHTHSLSIAADSGTADVTLAHDTTYKLTAGGSELIFTTPSDTDTKVSFVSTTNSNSYPLLFKYSTGSTTTANSARFNTGITVTPSTKTITATLFNGPSKYLVDYDEAYTDPGLNAYSLSYYSSCSKTTAANTNGIANPTCISTEYGDWYYHLLMIHKDSAGYFCDLAWRLDSSTDHSMYYRMRRGSSYTGWIKVLTSENYSDYISGGGSEVTVSTVTLASTAYYPIMTTGTGSKTTVYIANPSSGAKFYATSAGVYHTSDIQLKTNISRYFVNKELTENPVRKFDWKSGDGNDIIGFIAQEVEQWCPEAVRIDEFGYKSLNYNATLSALCGYLFDKIKELQNTVKELQEQINTNKC